MLTRIYEKHSLFEHGKSAKMLDHGINTAASSSEKLHKARKISMLHALFNSHISHHTIICSNYRSDFERLLIYKISLTHSGNSTIDTKMEMMKGYTLSWIL